MSIFPRNTIPGVSLGEEVAMGIVVIEPNGTIRAMYDDALVDVLSFGSLSIQRASHVEFCNESQAWFVDMQADDSLRIETFRVGPFAKHAEALAWEVVYLEYRLAGQSDVEACQLAGKEKRSENTNCYE